MKNLFSPFIGKLLVMACGLYFFTATSLHAQQDSNTSISNNVKLIIHNTPQKPEDISPLLIGEKIPMLQLQDAAGKNFDLNKAVATKPTILIFYRGGWCPFCSKQMAGLQEILPDLEKQGYQLLAISTDSPKGLSQSLTKEKLSYTLLSDADLNATKQFGLAYKAPKAYWEMLPKTSDQKNIDLLLPVPSVFIIDQKGIIQFEYINIDFKKRLNPALLLTIAKELKKDL